MEDKTKNRVQQIIAAFGGNELVTAAIVAEILELIEEESDAAYTRGQESMHPY